MLRLTLRSLVLAAVLCGAAHAQTAPRGWKVEADAKLWMATSPEQVRLAFYPAVKSRATFVYWFEDEGLRRTFGFGRDVRAQEQAVSTYEPEAGPLLAQTRTIKDAGGASIAVLSYAWETRQGRQMAQIVMPLALGGEHPSYRAAFEELTKAYRAKTAYTPAPAPKPAAKPAG